MRLFIVLAALLISGCTLPGRESSAAGVPARTAPPAEATATSEPTTAPAPLQSPAPTPAPTSTRRPDPPVAAAEPAGLAEQITLSERALRDPRVDGDELAWMAHLQQVAYRRLVERPEWRDDVLAALPAGIRAAAIANVNAGTDLRALTAPRDALPPWRIVAPAPADELLRYYREAEAEFGVPWIYLAAIHLIETRMGRIRGTSIAGAQGPMQFMPATWAAFGEGDVHSDRDAIRAAARYLRHNGAPGNMANALFRYNNSERYVRAVTAYALVMRDEPLLFRGYHGWQVYYRTTGGDVLLPVGYRKD